MASVTPVSFTPQTPPGVVLDHFRPWLTIAHQVPGRLRLKLGKGALNGVQFDSLNGRADTINAALRRIRGVSNISWNLLARSCTIEYDPAVIPNAAWPDLLAGTNTPAAQTLRTILDEAHEQLRHAAP
ncbi:MAG: hypothetical protein Q4B13_09900 [Lautropia sp.]|nr:hypothetical protein [Lautropia sp.]